MRPLLTLIVILSFYGCDQKNGKLTKKSISEPDTSVLKDRNLILNAINSNDTITYNQMAGHYILYNTEKDLFYYSLRMAYENNYPEAYYHIYFIIAYSTPKNPPEALKLMDIKMRNFALFHLLKAYELGYSRAKYEIDNIFGKEKFPTSDSFLDEAIKEYSRSSPK